jgi:hypothetical protein
MERIIRALRCERGAETLEWILIGGIIVLVGIAVYGPTSPLKTALTDAVTKVAGSLKSQ